VMPVDVTATASGAVLLLDAMQNRILMLRPGAATIEVQTRLDLDPPVSLVAASRDNVAYVAHRNGIARIDLRTQAVAPLGAARGTPLGGIERLTRHAAELVALQVAADGSRRVVRLVLDATGQSVTRRRVLGMPLPSGGAPVVAAVCGDTMSFLVAGVAPEWSFLQFRLER